MKIIDRPDCEVICGQPLGRVLNGRNTSLPVIGKIKVLVPKAISDGHINNEDITEEEIVKNCSPELFTREGDIVMKLSSPYEACYIRKENEGLLVSSFCSIIRVPKEIVWYVLAFLDSDNCKKQILRNGAGNVISILKIASIRSLEIPDLPLEKMKLIGDRYRKVQEIKFYVDEIYKLEQIRNSYEFTTEAQL